MGRPGQRDEAQAPNRSDDAELFRAIVETAPSAVLLAGVDAAIVLANRQAELLFGYTRSELIGLRLETLVPGLRRNSHFERRARQITPTAGVTGADLDLRGLRKDQSNFAAEVSITPITTRTGTVVAIGVQDVTERKLAERALREQTALHQALLAAQSDLGEGVALVDALEQRALYVNDALCRILRRDRAELLRPSGKLVDCIIPPHLTHWRAPDARVVTMALAERHETVFVREDGSRADLEISIKSLEGAGLRFMTIVRDVTERAAAARALRLAHDDLEARVQERTAELAEAVRVRDEFLSIASHELKTPLSAMLLQLQLLQDATSDEWPTRVAKASRSTRRLARLVDVLLDVSRIATGRFELQLQDELDLAALVREVNERFAEDAARAGCELRVDIGAEVKGRWDRFRMEQVYTNLLSNALKYGKGAPIEVRIASQDDVASLSVRDHGIGIARTELGRVFARFERAVSSRQYGGLGLGLYIAREIVTAHGGNISVESEEGLGSEFTVTVPIGVVARGDGGRA